MKMQVWEGKLLLLFCRGLDLSLPSLFTLGYPVPRSVNSALCHSLFSDEANIPRLLR